MRPLFTVHAGEYLVGIHIQQRLRLNVWIPAKDTGIDLLVTNRENRRAVSLQVKYGKDFLPERPASVRKSFRCLSWFTLNRAKLEKSPAQFWVFVLHGFKAEKPDFLIIPTAILLQRMAKVHGTLSATLHSYLSSTARSHQCWETRGLTNDAMLQIGNGTYKCPARDFSTYLNGKGWAVLIEKLQSA
jgi:hypothetical protein